MNAVDIMKRAAALGVSVWIDGERIGIEGPARGVVAIKPELAARKSEVLAYLVELRQSVKPPTDGGAYLPWGPYLSPIDVQRMRGELFDKVDALAQAEAWTPERYAETMDRARNGPPADLPGNVEYFTARLIERHAGIEAAALLAARSWRYEGRGDGNQASSQGSKTERETGGKATSSERQTGHAGNHRPALC